MLSDPGIADAIGVSAGAFSVENVRRSKQARVDSGVAGDWTIFFSADDAERFVGEAGIADWDSLNHIVEIFASIHPACGGKGFGVEAVSALMKHIFRSDPIATVRVQTLQRNLKALRLAGKLGFRESGRRVALPDPVRGFKGGTAVFLECRSHQFRLPTEGTEKTRL